MTSKGKDEEEAVWAYAQRRLCFLRVASETPARSSRKGALSSQVCTMGAQVNRQADGLCQQRERAVDGHTDLFFHVPVRAAPLRPHAHLLCPQLPVTSPHLACQGCPCSCPCSGLHSPRTPSPTPSRADGPPVSPIDNANL